jgi:hypothetical protein
LVGKSVVLDMPESALVMTATLAMIVTNAQADFSSGAAVDGMAHPASDTTSRNQIHAAMVVILGRYGRREIYAAAAAQYVGVGAISLRSDR